MTVKEVYEILMTIIGISALAALGVVILIVTGIIF
jgi:hypothetical protein